MPIHKKTNPALVALYQDLRKKGWEHDAPLWRDIADRLAKPTRNRAEVNVSRVDRFTSEGDTVLVPGKVLAAGELTKKVVVAAYGFSASARNKITKAGGECLTVEELVERHPNGTNVKILG